MPENGKDIAFIIEIAGRGGICHYTYNLCNEIGKRISVLLITGKNYELRNIKRSFRYIELFNRLKTNPLNIVKLIKLVHAEKRSVVHFQLSQYPVFILFLCILVKLFTSADIIITAHNVLSHEENFFTTFIFKKLYKLADKIIVHAKDNKKELLGIVELPEERVAVIPHGNYMFFNELSETTDLSDSKLIDFEEDWQYILFFGYIREYKGLSYLLDAMSDVVKEFPKTKLIVAGNPVEPFAPYQQKINKLNLINNIFLDLRYVPFCDVKRYFENCNVVVMPYIKVYQSGVLQLAYGFGKPVIVTDTGGMAEAVHDGETGFIVKPKDTGGLAVAIKKILIDRDMAKKMGTYALQVAETEYSWGSIAEKTIHEYDRVD